MSFSRIEKATQKSEIAHGAHLTYYMNKSSLEYKSHDRPIGRRNFINEKVFMEQASQLVITYKFLFVTRAGLCD